MAQLIASTYEIIEEIGSGGAGIVYLGNHIRLEKAVVLKADKRTIHAKPEVLRREVDALKNLSHSNIPQVYDFVEENGVVYTVMDYIQGESLDKPLKRGEKFPQSQVIEWACKILRALNYLHNRPPHGILHGDIKPANIMLTPEGDIKLIDYNIALALGEEGAVRVGFSRGYASPEHYGIDYVKSKSDDPITKLPNMSAETVLDSSVKSAGTGSSSGYGKKSVLLDVRSDIYSLGATLYHLLTGVRPEADANEVLPISDTICSRAVIEIIQKAMQPDPDLRYQTAEEMLYAFEHLRQNDSRTQKYKRRITITAASMAVMFLVGGILSLVGLKQMEHEQAIAKQHAEEAQIAAEAAEEEERLAKEREQAEKTALEAVGKAKEALNNGDVPTAIKSAAESWNISPSAEAQSVLTAALGVYELSDGYKNHRVIELPSEALKIEVSPEGARIAARVSGKVLVFDVETGEQTGEFAADKSALADARFIGENVLAYAGDDGLKAYDLNNNRELWTAKKATGIAVSEDGTTIAAVYRNETEAYVYNAVTGEQLHEVNFNGRFQRVLPNDVLIDPRDNLFALNSDGTKLAVSFDSNVVAIYDLVNSAGNAEVEYDSYIERFMGGFHENYLVFSAEKVDETELIILDTNEYRQLSTSSKAGFAVKTDAQGIYISQGNLLTNMYDPSTPADRELAFPNADITDFDVGEPYTIVAMGKKLAFYDEKAVLLEQHEDTQNNDFVLAAGDYAITAAKDSVYIKIYKLETHNESQLFTYDRNYIHTESRISADGSRIMLFDVNGFRIYSANGEIIADVMIPDAIQLYDQQFRRNESGSYLECIYNDGTVVAYSADDGRILSTTQQPPHDGTLYDEFYTEKLKITSPINAAPAAYDRETGELIRELESNAYLTYVTQVGEYVITEYISAQGDRFGLLLNEKCETLAELPNLCDITEDGTLVFDDMKGNLRKSRIYSIEELLALAEKIGG